MSEAEGDDEARREDGTLEEDIGEEDRRIERVLEREGILTLRPLIPAPRSGHVCVIFNDVVWVWGGYMSRDNDEDHLHTSVIWHYDIQNKMWTKMETTGDVPMSTSGSQGCILEPFLYVFAGHGMFGTTNALRRLNLHTLEWERTGARSSFQPTPRDKYALWTSGDSIFFFGGFVHEFNTREEDGEFDEDRELTWGTAPSPRAAHAVACFEDSVYMFGGRNNQGRHNDLHRFHLPSSTWSGRLSVGGELPCGRSWHTLTAVTPTLAFLYGGYSNDSMPLGDSWLLDTEKLQWSRLRHLSQDNPRIWHTAVCSSQEDVLVFGGCANNIMDMEVPAVHTNTMLYFRVSPKSLLRLTLERVWESRRVLEPFWDVLPDVLRQPLRDFQVQHEYLFPSQGS